MKKITISLIILLSILSSCANRKQVSKSSIETNITTQIDSISNTKTSYNKKTETNDSTEIIIQETIEETISDTLNNQTIQRTIKRKSTITKSGNIKIEQSEETDTAHNKHIQNKENKKEDNQSTTTIKHSNVRRYLSVIMIMILLILIYKFISNRSQ